MNRAFFGALRFLYPDDAACVACNRPVPASARGLCAGCAKKIRKAGDIPCPPHLQGFTAGFLYTGALHGALHRFKYDHRRYLARFFGEALTLPEAWRGAALVPVPLHPARLRARGYNQSLLLAEELHKRYLMPVDGEVLRRVRPTGTQTERTREERMASMAGAFIAAPSAAGREFVLVDDVMTTGSTLRACAQALREKGAARVYAACACAAP